jgi:hypothetical protein
MWFFRCIKIEVLIWVKILRMKHSSQVSEKIRWERLRFCLHFFPRDKSKSPMEIATFWFGGKSKNQFVTLRKHQRHVGSYRRPFQSQNSHRWQKWSEASPTCDGTATHTSIPMFHSLLWFIKKRSSKIISRRQFHCVNEGMVKKRTTRTNFQLGKLEHWIP